MKRIISIILCILIIGTAFAQQPKNLQKVNSTEIIIKGINYHDEGKYQEALAEYAKIPFGDPYYDLAIYEKALTQEMMGDYRAAIQNINELLDNPSCQINRNKSFMVLGDCYDYLEQYDKAVEAYDEALRYAPYDYLTIFNKGVSLMGNDKYEEALECFKKSIFINPAHQGSHFRYGLCCLQLGYTVPGILALNYSTLINTSSKYCLTALQELDELYDNGISGYNKDHDVDISDEYEELNAFYKDIHQLLNSRAAETQKFHSLAKVNHNIVKYNQLVFANVKVRPGSHAIEDMLYIPFFQQVLDKKQFNTLCYYQLQETDVDNGKVAKKAEKMKKEFNVLINDILVQLREQAELGLGIENNDGITYYYTDRYKLHNWGKLITLSKNEQLEEGEWITINDNGQIVEISNFSMGKAEGLAQLFEKGELVQKAMAKNGKADGHVYIYTPDPVFHTEILSEEFDMKNDEYVGLYRTYSSIGVLQKEGTLVKGKFDGLVSYYDEQGHLIGQENYVNGKQYGQNKSYYPGGQLKGEYRMGNEDEITEFHEFYIDGAKKQDGFIKNDQKVREWTSYLPSGKIRSKEVFDDEGQANGEGTSYFSNGKVNTKININHGKYVQYEDFGPVTGVPTCTYLFDNDKLTKMTSYMPDGSVRKEYPVSGKNVNFDLYSEFGYKRINGTLDNDFNWQKVRTEYFPNGLTKVEATFKDDQLNGDRKEYYENGRLKAYYSYKDGKANGVLIDYYNNKENSIADETYYENDTIKGDYYQYFFDGNLKQVGKNDESGTTLYVCSYRPDKTKKMEVKYYHGVPCLIISYNRYNEVIARDTLINGNGVFKYYYPEGQLQSTIPYVGGNANGVGYSYSLNGQVMDSAMYVSGGYNSYHKNYYPTGELEYETKLVQNNFHGKYSNYTPDGKKMLESTYEYGDITHSIHYTIDGKLYFDCDFTDGERTGKTRYYAPDGKTLLYEIMYDHDQAVSISCVQKNGKMSEPVFIGTEDQTFKAYYPNGTVGAVISFRNGLYNGTKSVYYPNGQAYQTVVYSDNMNDGPTIVYYANGKIYNKVEYKEDMKHGADITYYPNGQIHYEGNYYYDLPHGAFNTYDKEGKLIHKVIMYYGQPIIDERY